MQVWQGWWAWIAGGGVLAILEGMVSGYVLLGFAGGAILTGVLVALGLLGTSLPLMLLVFAVGALASWLALRRIFGLPKGNVTVIHHDINDN